MKVELSALKKKKGKKSINFFGRVRGVKCAEMPISVQYYSECTFCY